MNMANIVRLETQPQPPSCSVGIGAGAGVAMAIAKSMQPSPEDLSSPFLSLTKPSWIVKTESNVRKEIRKKAHPSCVICQGTGRVDCHHCSGQGRTNCVHLPMLPKGEWPKWCKVCGGSGLSFCSRCLGTGEYRYIMGFHFMNRGTGPHDTPHPTQNRKEPHDADNLLKGR